MARFTWLLFSDPACGAGDLANGRWSDEFLSGLQEDLATVRSQLARPLDAVFLAGNITKSAKREEFETASNLLTRLFGWLGTHDKQRPLLFAVPGNKDLNRVELGTRLELYRGKVWGMEKRDTVLLQLEKAFGTYESWARRWRAHGLRPGELPGDFVTDSFENPVGIVGINSAVGEWVGVTEERLDQLCLGSTSAWAVRYAVQVLLSHQPPWEWPTVGETPPLPVGLFQIHLCGASRGDIPFPVQHRSTVLIQCPGFSETTSGHDPGYVAGTFDTTDPSQFEVWVRTFDRERKKWGSAHHLQDRFRLSLPLKKKQVSFAAAEVDDGPIFIESLRLVNFRCFDQLELPLRAQSRLPGEWTCLAGINGAGKSSILQAVCLALLGDKLIRELGGERLNRMRRRLNGERKKSEIEIVLSSTKKDLKFTSRIEIGADGEVQIHSDAPNLRSQVLASYGATRNLTSRVDSGYEHLSADVRRQITLFDPLSQLANAEVLLKGQSVESPVMKLFRNLAAQIFDTELRIEGEGADLRFVVGQKDRVEAMDLPDGFRASAAWLADLCAIWADKAPEIAANGNPGDIEGIVLIDEIDLHLHPSLQRSLVPRLRTALPKVQWVVSTHSPLVLSNFDSNEIIALDRDLEGNIRPLDRQIMGFSTDQIYEWLMDTSPHGEAMEQVLEENEQSGDPSDDEVAELLRVSPVISDEEAREKVKDLKGVIERLKP